jgi:hypothetical protein
MRLIIFLYIKKRLELEIDFFNRRWDINASLVGAHWLHFAVR